eukprot:CAMPEP_0174722920 /NCGR_PEP_ID=MMETSP1094-20130205/39631_1 /TAXON_ID=156173 /ORGANISM="Chrysochromulina brevifilum, Strain UTEX LB 985" /LENGTH=42 /DNA_ID= /DNA_START= /DNA_END= /DNA_ORIENTATION=
MRLLLPELLPLPVSKIAGMRFGKSVNAAVIAGSARLAGERGA